MFMCLCSKNPTPYPCPCLAILAPLFISSLVKAYWHILNIETLLRHIHAYLVIFSTLCNPHILTAGIFTTGGLFKTLWSADQAYSKPCHRTLSSHIPAYSGPCAMLAYIETWHTQKSWNIQKPFHNCTPTHIQNPVIFTKISVYSELWHI